MFNFLQRFFKPQTQKPQLQTFILEPILTPSGLVDGGDEFDIVDLPDSPELDFNLEINEELEVVPFFDTDYPEDIFDGGVFSVGDTGEVTIDFLYDGGGYEGELAIFSLDGMGELEPGSDEFVRVAVERALNESELGHVVISDATEGARFSGELGETDRNSGDYLGLKTVQMKAGDKFAVMLIPHGTVEDVDEVLSNGESLRSKMRPLFSLATANPEDGLQLGQIADVDGSGSTFVMEDLGIDGKSDRDYNDIIFQFKGATGEAIELDEVIKPGQDWRETETGESLLDYTNFDGEEIEVATTLSETVQTSLERVTDLEIYDPEALAKTSEWVVGLSVQEISPDVLTLLQAENLGATQHISNTYVWQFSEDITPQQVQQRLANLTGVEFAYPLVEHEHNVRSLSDDTPLWHLHNTGQTGGSPNADLNVLSVWDEGIQGEGVTVAIVDDGVKYDHPNLTGNYRPDLGRDFAEKTNQGVYDINPAPTYHNLLGSLSWDSHGTQMAGIIAGTGENDIFGIAPETSLIALRQSLSSNDLEEADALSYLRDDIDIYNNSWGPTDASSGYLAHLSSVDPLTIVELQTGVDRGRNGLGSIFVWAAGNGGRHGDNINYDGYANSRYTIAVGAVDHHGFHIDYSEEGAALLVSAYSGNPAQSNSGIYTTDIAEPKGYPPTTNYTNKADGTSAAAAMISGVVALILEANPSLSWRDVQHILVETSRKNDLSDYSWDSNASGYEHSYKYGFGVVDAAAAVNAAKNWQTVGTEVSLEYDGDLNQAGFQSKEVKRDIRDGKVLTSTISIDEEITVESAEVVFDAAHDNIGDLKVVLVSPDGTESILAEPHRHVKQDYSSWKFTSLRHWGESSKGDWTLRVIDKKGNNQEGIWNSWRLNLHGAKPVVNIIASDPEATEGEDPGAFTITRTGSTKYPLTVEYRDIVGATTENHTTKAALGKDYNLPPTITIPAGQAAVTIPVQAVDDTEAEFPEVVRLELTESNAYDVGAVDTDNDKVIIWDNEKPAVWLINNQNNTLPAWKELDEKGRPGNEFQSFYGVEGIRRSSFFVRRQGSLKESLDVNLSITGTAINGVDYVDSYNGKAIPETITIEAGELQTSISLFFPDDGEVEEEETVNVQLLSSENYTFSSYHRTLYDYILGQVGDINSKPIISLVANDPEASESGDPGQFTLERTGDTSEDLTVNYWIQVSARRKDVEHFEPIPLSATIPAGSSSTTIDVKPIDNDLIDGDTAVIFYLVSDLNYIFGASKSYIVTIKDDDAPSLSWQQSLGQSGFDNANDIVADQEGNVYIVGKTADESGIGDAFIAQYNRQGQKQWQENIATSGYEDAIGVGVDDVGNIYVVGWTDGELKEDNPRRDTWIAKYNNQGEQQWLKLLGNENYDISKGGMVVDGAGNIYLAGYTYGRLEGVSQGNTDAWVAKFNSDGDQEWVKQQGISTSVRDEVKDVAVDGEGNVYVTGQTGGKLGNEQFGGVDTWVSKFDRQGEQQWVQQLGTATPDEVSGIVVDDQGYVYITGQTQGWLGDPYLGQRWALWAIDDRYKYYDRSLLGERYYGNGDAWIGQLNATDGAVNWKRLLGTPGADGANDIAINQSGDVYITGYTHGQLGTTHFGTKDIFAARFDEEGILLWKDQLGTAGEDTGNGIVVGSDGLYLTGSSSGGFGGENQGGEDVWIAKFA